MLVYNVREAVGSHDRLYADIRQEYDLLIKHPSIWKYRKSVIAAFVDLIMLESVDEEMESTKAFRLMLELDEIAKDDYGVVGVQEDVVYMLKHMKRCL